MRDAPDNDSEMLERMRHSCAHVMAAAVQQIWPDARFGVGPTTEDGFFYDIATDEPISVNDLKKIEKAMKKIKARREPFEIIDTPVDEAIGFMEEHKQPFKVELLSLLRDKGSTAIAAETGDANAVADGLDAITFYKTGKFVDLCRGPHVEHSGEIGEFKLISIAGAYWRGNADNAQLQRIYGLCYPTREELDHRVWQLEERKKRDHRKLGKELKLFSFEEEVGPGLPFWLPNGRVVRDELEQLAREFERADGYQPVSTPEITKADLFYKSRHLPYYREDMYAPMDIDEEEYFLRPMNCPFHHLVYRNDQRSYRELPLRVAEYGKVYRYEASGGLSGLMRTRGFCQNDAHIYCREDQAKDEFIRVMDLHARYYELFGIKNYWMRVSLPDLDDLSKYVDDEAGWRKALDIMMAAMKESGYPYTEVTGEAAFYGPKVDFMIESAIGTEYAISTNQLDFLATTTFDLKYVSDSGEPEPLYVIHRAPLGSHERFVAFLIEHYAGAFPVWLSPVQARVIPIADRHEDYARQVEASLFSAVVRNGTGGLRVDVDAGSERMQKKIRTAQTQKIPYMLVVGDSEAENGTVSVRHRSGHDFGAMPLEAFLERLKTEAEGRTDLEVPVKDEA